MPACGTPPERHAQRVCLTVSYLVLGGFHPASASGMPCIGVASMDLWGIVDTSVHLRQKQKPSLGKHTRPSFLPSVLPSRPSPNGAPRYGSLNHLGVEDTLQRPWVNP